MNPRFAYKHTKTGISVYLDGMKVGSIKNEGELWFYVPKGQKAKDVHPADKFFYLKTVTTIIEGDS